MALFGIAAGLLGSAFSSRKQSKAVEGATDEQLEASRLAIDEQGRQFDAMQEILSPFVQGGNQTLAGQLGILGMGPEGAQQAAIDQIQQSPMFQSLLQQGESSILQNASATGGLRGGNTQAALAQFSPALLNQQIQQQFQNLGGLTQLGQASAARVGSAGMQTGANVSNLLMDRGQAIGQGALAQGRIGSQFTSDLAGGIGQLGAELFPNLKIGGTNVF